MSMLPADIHRRLEPKGRNRIAISNCYFRPSPSAIYIDVEMSAEALKAPSPQKSLIVRFIEKVKL